VSGTLTVHQAPLTITASSPTITYGKAIPQITPSYQTLANGDTSLATPPTCSTNAGAVGSKPAGGIYKTTCLGASDPNYSITYASGSLTVKPAPLTVTASSPTVTYPGPVPAVGCSYSGLQNGDAAPKTPATGSTTAGGPGSAVAAGTYNTTCSGASDPNYQISYQTGTLSVKKASLLIRATNETATYGHRLPNLQWSGNFVNGDASRSLTTAPSCHTKAQVSSGGIVTSPEGFYVIICANASDPNYSISYKAGYLAVKTASVSITYTGPQVVKHNGTATLGAVLKSDISAPVVGRKLDITVTAANGHTQSCNTNPTGLKGIGWCTIKHVLAGPGTHTVRLSFSGDPAGNPQYYRSGFATHTIRVT
jgi:hypothetical protein